MLKVPFCQLLGIYKLHFTPFCLFNIEIMLRNGVGI